MSLIGAGTRLSCKKACVGDMCNSGFHKIDCIFCESDGILIALFVRMRTLREFSVLRTGLVADTRTVKGGGTDTHMGCLLICGWQRV